MYEVGNTENSFKGGVEDTDREEMVKKRNKVSTFFLLFIFFNRFI